jgi:hypothetical protein
MAKKKLRSAEAEEEEEFAPPPFNEREFYLGELEMAKATMVAAVWGILIAVVSTAVFALAGSFYFGLAAGVLAALVLKPLLDRLRLVKRKQEAMKWLGMFFSYFLCWLSFWILLVNPPIMDLTPPHLRDRTPEYQEIGSSLRLSIEVMENSGLNELSAELRLPGGGVEKRQNFSEVTTKLFQLDLNYTVAGVYSYHILAVDGTGRSASRDGQTEIVPSRPPEISLIVPPNGTTISVDTPIYLKVTDNALISGVHYTLDNSTERIFLKPIKGYDSSYRSDYVKSNIYKIMPKSAGQRWALGAHNVTVTAADGAGNQASQTWAFTII